MRLDKYLSQQLGISRKEAIRELRAKKVILDGEVVKTGAHKITESHDLYYKGRRLSYTTGYSYFMLNKPAGYVCSKDNSEHPTIFRFIEENNAHKLHIAGRLDLDATGLLLLTDDGQWSHRLTSPRYFCKKTYLVHLAEPLKAQVEQIFLAGIQLNHENKKTKSAKLERITDLDVRLTIIEGKYHQVKRMFAAVGNRVISLHRECVGDIKLDSTLKLGEYRALTSVEINKV